MKTPNLRFIARVWARETCCTHRYKKPFSVALGKIDGWSKTQASSGSRRLSCWSYLMKSQEKRFSKIMQVVFLTFNLHYDSNFCPTPSFRHLYCVIVLSYVNSSNSSQIHLLHIKWRLQYCDTCTIRICRALYWDLWVIFSTNDINFPIENTFLCRWRIRILIPECFLYKSAHALMLPACDVDRTETMMLLYICLWHWSHWTGSLTLLCNV